MAFEQIDLDGILSMRSKSLKNYIIPGLTSSLIGGEQAGCVRLFECGREHEETITPHSHRFDFRALVLRGTVTNHIWESKILSNGDPYQCTRLIYLGAPGQYEKEPIEVSRWTKSSIKYSAGHWYGMTHDQVHSIQFSRNAIVLFFEGPEVARESVILEPWVDGETIPTLRTEPWMFQPAQAGADRAGDKP